MSPYRLQYRIRKCISSCEGRQQLKLGLFFPRERFVVHIKNCLTDTLIWVLRLHFLQKGKQLINFRLLRKTFFN